MGDRIQAWLGVAAIFAVLVALVAFPPAGIVVAAAVGYWMLRTNAQEHREFRERIEREEREPRDD